MFGVWLCFKTRISEEIINAMLVHSVKCWYLTPIFVQIFFCSVNGKEIAFCRSENIRCSCSVLRNGRLQHCKALKIRFYFFYEEAIRCRTGPMTIESFVYCHGCLWRVYHPVFNFLYNSFSFVFFSFFLLPPLPILFFFYVVIVF